VAGSRLESFYMAISCIDRGWAWLDVALELSPLAPFLAPGSSAITGHVCPVPRAAMSPAASGGRTVEPVTEEDF